MGRVIHTGQVVIDLTLRIEAIPEPGGDVFADESSMAVGGGFNVLAAARRMGVETLYAGPLGEGPFAEAARRGSAAHDEIISVNCGTLTRTTNRAGGIEGGISNGSDVRVRAAFKPISTVPKALRTVDLATGEPATGLHQRSDVCAVVPGAVIAQAMTALVLADLLLDKTGGDSVDEARRNLRSYLTRIAERTQWRTER